MKRLISILSVMMILSVMTALLPTGSAFAAKDPGSVALVIHNLTGGNANFDLVDPNGVHHSSVLPKGITKMDVTQGWHAFFAGLRCGDRSGEFNMNVAKELYLSCGKGDETTGVNIDIMKLARRSSPWYCYDVLGVWESEAPVKVVGQVTDGWMNIGSICQNFAATQGDTTQFYFPGEDEGWLDVTFFNNGENIVECYGTATAGSAYYTCSYVD